LGAALGDAAPWCDRAPPSHRDAAVAGLCRPAHLAAVPRRSTAWRSWRHAPRHVFGAGGGTGRPLGSRHRNPALRADDALLYEPREIASGSGLWAAPGAMSKKGVGLWAPCGPARPAAKERIWTMAKVI